MDNDEIYTRVSRKTFFFTVFATCAFSLLCMFTAIVSNNNTTEIEYIRASSAPCAFLLKSIDGNVAVCDEYDGSLLEILDINVNALPEEEQLALDTGIYIESLAKLISTIESYTS